MNELEPKSFFNLEGQIGADLFQGLDLVWEALDRIKPFVLENIKPNISEIRKNGDFVARTHVLWQGQVLTDDLELKPGDATKGDFEVMWQGRRLEEAIVVYAGAALLDDRIELGPGVVVEPGALLKGPTIIGARTEVRQGAYVRGSCLTGRACVVGHATEMKNTVMLDGAKAGHFAYLGDSLLGREVNLGAGTKLANLKMLPRPIVIEVGGRKYQVERRKFGAVLGDGIETGCNSVTNPGAVLSPGCLVSPNMTVAPGYYPRRTVIRPKKH